MGEYVVKLPDIGEGITEAELVEWNVEEGQIIREEDVLASVMTDKATVEIPSPVSGQVLWRGGNAGEMLAVGSPLIRLEVAGEEGAASLNTVAGDAVPDSKKVQENASVAEGRPVLSPAQGAAFTGDAHDVRPVDARNDSKPAASPVVRKRARENDVDLRDVTGTGRKGRITAGDLALYLDRRTDAKQREEKAPDSSVKKIPIVGLRRKIAEKMTASMARIPHITYIDEVDMTETESIRAQINRHGDADQVRLTLLPFLMKAIEYALAEYPHFNARYDDRQGVLHQYGALHMGIATQTPHGLVVPVVRHVESRSLRDCAEEIDRLARAAKTGTASREELTGSTITLTSLGTLGGLATTPIINEPEVAIIGVNKMQQRPVWHDGQFVPRTMMNLSSSFDHRIIDGWEAAMFIQKTRSFLEAPAVHLVKA